MDVIIIVVQTKELAEQLRQIITLPNVIITFYGANILGFNRGGVRPNIALCAYEERGGCGWTNEVLRAGLAPGARFLRFARA